MNTIKNLTIYCDGEDRPLVEALSIITDDFIDAGECSDQTKIDLRDACKELYSIYENVRNPPHRRKEDNMATNFTDRRKEGLSALAKVMQEFGIELEVIPGTYHSLPYLDINLTDGYSSFGMHVDAEDIAKEAENLQSEK